MYWQLLFHVPKQVPGRAFRVSGLSHIPAPMFKELIVKQVTAERVLKTGSSVLRWRRVHVVPEPPESGPMILNGLMAP
jgi:hypothetical protein